jgi:hypothetical protein
LLTQSLASPACYARRTCTDFVSPAAQSGINPRPTQPSAAPTALEHCGSTHLVRPHDFLNTGLGLVPPKDLYQGTTLADRSNRDGRRSRAESAERNFLPLCRRLERSRRRSDMKKQPIRIACAHSSDANKRHFSSGARPAERDSKEEIRFFVYPALSKSCVRSVRLTCTDWANLYRASGAGPSADKTVSSAAVCATNGNEARRGKPHLYCQGFCL